MFKRLICVLVMLAVVSAGTMITGCGDDIRTDRKTEIRDVPVGEPKVIID